MFLLVDLESHRPAYLQLRDQIVEGIATGDLRRGDPLPSVRRLAADLGLNLHTVNKAFDVLRQEGFIHLSQRRGAVVDPTPAPQDARDRLEAALRPILAEAIVKGVSPDAVVDRVRALLEPLAAPVPQDGGRQPAVRRSGRI